MFHCFRAGLGQRRIFDIDEILQVLREAIKRLQSVVQIVGENAFPFSFDFAGNDADALAIELLNVRLLIAQHVDRAAGVKAAHDDGDPLGAENLCHVHGAGKLIGLDADQANEQFNVRRFAPADNFCRRHLFGGFIESSNVDRQGSENAPRLDVFGQAMEHVQSVARQDAFPKTDHVTFVVVFGRFD